MRNGQIKGNGFFVYLILFPVVMLFFSLINVKNAYADSITITSPANNTSYIWNPSGISFNITVRYSGTTTKPFELHTISVEIYSAIILMVMLPSIPALSMG